MDSRRILVAAAVAACAAFAALAAGRYIVDSRMSNFGESCTIYVRPETSAADVEAQILDLAGVSRPRSLSRSFDKEDVRTGLKPGKYTVEAGRSSRYVARMLTRGWQTPQNLTFSGTIRTRERLASLISKQMMLDSLEVIDALNDNSFLKEYGMDTTGLFAYILPDTYQMYWTDGMDRIMTRLRKEYDSFWNEERRAQAAEAGLTPYEISVLASIVSGETRAASEYSRIAGVYLNRLRSGMLLQADPTVCYCYGYTLTRVLKKHLEIDSPYNTYKYAGLPPSPINVPPKACVEAALKPEKHNYLYFCASDAFDGTHKFSASLGGHMDNARAFQAELTRRQRARKAGK